MEISIIPNRDLVVAIDIGSTYSGYAWQWKSDFHNNRSNVQFNTNWGSGALQLHKTSTCILLKPKQGCGDEYDIEAFGNAAEQLYTSMSKDKPGEIDGKWYFFKQFKHLLHLEEFNREMKVEDQNGQRMSLLYVMSKFIEALKGHFIDNLTQKGQRVVMDKTLWVITVPAIWSNEEKRFMREAAEMSGIKKKNVLLALEPEAAAIYCIHLPSEQRENMNNLGTPGQVFLTADLGGITADLSAIKVFKDGFIEEICIAQGELSGGQNVNNAFFQACHDSLEGNAWKKIFSKAAPVEMLEMEDDFEQKKVRIGTADPRAENITLKVPRVVRKGIEKSSIKLKKTSDGETTLKLKDDELLFNSAFIRKKLFKETCLSICNIIKRELKQEQLQECKTVVLVGGFAESPIVVSHIREMIQDTFPEVNVVVPTSPFQAVLKGAVLYGHDPMIFRSRIARFTYGIAKKSPFDGTKHDEKKKWLNRENGKYYCSDIFDVHVVKGQSVVLNEKQKCQTYHPMFKEQKSANIAVYASTKIPIKEHGADNPASVLYTTDEGCEKVGHIEVLTPNTTGGTERNITVRMIYGGTELSVIALDQTTGKEFSADFKYTNM